MGKNYRTGRSWECFDGDSNPGRYFKLETDYSSGRSPETVSTDDDETDGAGTADDGPGVPEAETPEDPVSNYWLYVSIGLLTGVIAWLLVPLFGVGTVYAGYELYRGESKTISGGFFIVAGSLRLIIWITFLVLTFWSY